MKKKELKQFVQCQRSIKLQSQEINLTFQMPKLVQNHIAMMSSMCMPFSFYKPTMHESVNLITFINICIYLMFLCGNFLGIIDPVLPAVMI